MAGSGGGASPPDAQGRWPCQDVAKFKGALHIRCQAPLPLAPFLQAPFPLIHSLGGALATLCAYDIAVCERLSGSVDVSCYTFGAPRTGNHVFAELYTRAVPDTWHIINNDVGTGAASVFVGRGVMHCSWVKPAPEVPLPHLHPVTTEEGDGSPRALAAAHPLAVISLPRLYLHCNSPQTRRMR